MKQYRYSVRYIGLDPTSRYTWSVECSTDSTKWWNECAGGYASFQGSAVRKAKRVIKRRIKSEQVRQKHQSIENVPYPQGSRV